MPWDAADDALSRFALPPGAARDTALVVDGPSEPLSVVEAVVRAVVGRDLEAIAAITSPKLDDLYEWTRDYGPYDEVELQVPSGPAATWEIDWLDEHGGGKYVVVAMWTRQEGRSDLSLEMELQAGPDGDWQAEILNLHVL